MQVCGVWSPPPVCRWCPCVPRVPQPSGDLGPSHRLRGQQDLLHQPHLLPQVQTDPHPPHSLDRGRSSRCEHVCFAFCMRGYLGSVSVPSLQTKTTILVCLPRSASRWSPRLLGIVPRASSSPGRRGGLPPAVPALLTTLPHCLCSVFEHLCPDPFNEFWVKIADFAQRVFVVPTPPPGALRIVSAVCGVCCAVLSAVCVVQCCLQCVLCSAEWASCAGVWCSHPSPRWAWCTHPSFPVGVVHSHLSPSGRGALTPLSQWVWCTHTPPPVGVVHSHPSPSGRGALTPLSQWV